MSGQRADKSIRTVRRYGDAYGGFRLVYSAYEEEEPSVAQFDASNSHTLRPEGNKGENLLLYSLLWAVIYAEGKCKD